eukprot:IDg12578t1
MSSGEAGPSGHNGQDVPVPSPAFFIPDLEARLEPDIVVMDAVRSFLVDEPLESVLATAAEVITEDIVHGASPTFLLLLKRLLSSKGAMPDYIAGTNIRETRRKVPQIFTERLTTPTTAVRTAISHRIVEGPQQRDTEQNATVRPALGHSPTLLGASVSCIAGEDIVILLEHLLSESASFPE